MNPEELDLVDFGKKLEDYDGTSPAVVAASVAAADLVQGFTRQALFDPELVRITEKDVERTWSRP